MYGVHILSSFNYKIAWFVRCTTDLIATLQKGNLSKLNSTILNLHINCRIYILALEIRKVKKNPKHQHAAAAAAKSLQSCLTLCDAIDGSPTGSPHPWDSPGKNTGVGCHFLLQCIIIKWKKIFYMISSTVLSPSPNTHTSLGFMEK